VRRRTLVLAVTALAVSAFFSPLASAGTGVRVLKTAGPVTDLAADGQRVAVGVEATRKTCDRIAVWNPIARRVTIWSARTSCPPGDQTSGGEFLGEVGLAGSRVAWIEVLQGNNQELLLYTATLGNHQRTEVEFVSNGNGAGGDPVGDYVGHLHGDGSVFAYDKWSLCIAYPPGSEVDPPPQPPCDTPGPPPDPVEVAYDQELRAIGRAQPIATGSSAYPLVFAGGGRLVVLGDGEAVLVDAEDGAVSAVAVPDGTTDAALSGDDVVVLHGRTLEVVGGPSYLLPFAGGTPADLTDVEKGITVVVAGRKVYLVDLVTGNRHAIAVPGVGRVDAELEASGLFYSYTAKRGTSRGRVVFTPFATVASLVG
jgi:hypothetical protein